MRLCFLALSLLFLASACRNDPKQARTTGNFRFLDDTVVTYNRGIMKTEDQEIADYIKRRGWEMTTTSTGLRYVIYYKGNGTSMTAGNRISLKYEVTMLDGRELYSSEQSGLKEFIQGKTEVEPGLNELVLMLKGGDKAKAILPAHLAYGLLGDQNLVPPGATLVYDIEVIGVSPAKK